MSTSSPTQQSTRAARLTMVEDLRELLRQHGKGGTLVDAAISDGDAESEPDDDLPALIPRGALGVIAGEWSSGKTSLALSRVARATSAGERAAIVDSSGWLFPPALDAMGGVLERVLLLRPSPERVVWAGEQLLRSGLFGLVVLLGLKKVDTSSLRRLQLAAERGWTTGVLVPDAGATVSPGLVTARIQVQTSAPISKNGRATIAAPRRQPRVRLERRGHAGREARHLDVALAIG